MNGTNVDYYVSGFDTAGKRVGSLICDFDPNKDKNAEKLAALKEKAKTLFTDAAVIDVVSASDYNQYLTGEYVRGADGKPAAYVAPEPTAEEQKAALKADYDSAVKELTDSMAVALLTGDTDAQESIRADFKDLQAQYKEAMENV